MKPALSKRRTALAALAVVVLAGWGLWRLASVWSAGPPPGGSALGLLTRGELFSPDPWLDPGELVAPDPPDAWHLAPSRWLVVAEGWGGPEEWGAWGLGERTVLHFLVRRPGPRDLWLEVMAPPDPAGRAQTVEIAIDGEPVASLTVGQEWESHRLPLPPRLLKAGSHQLELAYGYHLAGIPGRDDRPLALAFRRLGLVAPGREPPAPGRPSTAAQDELRLNRSGTLLVPLRVPADAEALSFDLETAGPRAARREIACRYGVVTLDGRRRLVRATLSAWPWASRPRIALRPHRGELVFLAFAAEIPGGGELVIRSPRLLRRQDPVAGPPARPPRTPGKRPHVVLIVLDAARADHFGVYGYPRATTPVIDRLAAESLVFTQAVAECSYTVCSMPAMLTGLSFPRHRLYSKSQALAPGVRTLAETLAAAGYRTIAYTGNPNNSRLTATDQGFGEFHEIWEVHPEFITREVERLAAEGLGERPVFLHLHYVPPHEPYAPDPAFDLFGDPAYAGPVTSDRDFVRAVYRGSVDLEAADLDRLVALYDGNLRMADAAVGRVLAALRRAGLWDDALVVVTSDHGEAFAEHGRIGHNTTVYDEMVRVPLILRLPRWLADRGPELRPERLTSLADLAPAILDLAGVASGLRTAGKPRQVVFLRSAQTPDPFFGVRTERWKAIARSTALPELYDLRADPGETVNLAARSPLVYAGLILLLRQALAAPAPLRAELRPEVLSSADEAMLGVLGYLEPDSPAGTD